MRRIQEYKAPTPMGLLERESGVMIGALGTRGGGEVVAAAGYTSGEDNDEDGMMSVTQSIGNDSNQFDQSDSNVLETTDEVLDG
mmetsp:Transcript_77033/g.176711  ORF Transcript_77033/g.176711 Transcript_77033/m.176711 type:complete len:84 (+) Transcript_77033:2-253(+)